MRPGGGRTVRLGTAGELEGFAQGRHDGAWMLRPGRRFRQPDGTIRRLFPTMSLLPQPALPDSFGPYQAFRQHLGFVPAILRAQSLLPRAIEAEAAIVGAFLIAPGALTRARKEVILWPSRAPTGAPTA